jgi:hypothetical protein
MAQAEKILFLRKLLDDRFGASAPLQTTGFTLDWAPFDDLSLPSHSLIEVVTDPRLPGGTLFLAGLLQAAASRHQIILLDGKDSFAPESFRAEDLARLVWVRCHNAVETVKAADLVVRDGNVSLAILLLTINPMAELRRIHANAWHRLQMLAEKSGMMLFAFTPFGHIGCARARLSISGHFPLGALELSHTRLASGLSMEVQRRRQTIGDSDVRRAACA